jgi:hypothetical protein
MFMGAVSFSCLGDLGRILPTTGACVYASIGMPSCGQRRNRDVGQNLAERFSMAAWLAFDFHESPSGQNLECHMATVIS